MEHLFGSKYDALKPLFDLDLQDEEIPAEPIPQHTILHSIERILVIPCLGKTL